MWKILAEVQSEQMIGAYHAVLLFAQMCIVVGEMGGVCYFLLYIYIAKKCRKYFGTCKVYSKQLNVRSNKCDKPSVEQFILQEDEKSLHNITQQHL